MYPADKIRIAMASQGLNNKEVAEKSGLTRQTVADITTGRAKDPKLSTIKTIVNAVGLEVEIHLIPKAESAEQPQAA